MTDHLIQILQIVGMILGPIMAFIMALIAALKAHAAQQEAKASRVETAALQATMAAPVTPSSVPSISLVQAFKYLDYINQVANSWSMVRHLHPGESGEIPRIRTIIEGRDVSIGPSPIKING